MEHFAQTEEKKKKDEHLAPGEVCVHELMAKPVQPDQELTPHVTMIHSRFLPTAVDSEYEADGMQGDTYFTVQEGARYAVKVDELKQKRRNTGGYGCVITGRDLETNAPIAIKFLRPDKQNRVPIGEDVPKELARSMNERARLLYREYRTLRSILNPHVVAARDRIAFAEVNGVMVPGIVMDRLQPLPRHLLPNEAANLVSQVAEGLDEMHAQGIVHYDIKPGNIMMENGNRYVITDFGGCYNKNEAMEGPFTFTEQYADPQVIEENELGAPKQEGDDLGTVDYRKTEANTVLADRADQYALALTAYELMYHTDPNHAFTQIDGQRKLRSGFGVDPEVLAVLRKATSYDRSERYPDCKHFARALADAVEMSQQSERRYTELPKRLIRWLLG
ncbi:MAG: serine/threonine protein kinase [Patescibacteria group bacterium]